MQILINSSHHKLTEQGKACPDSNYKTFICISTEPIISRSQSTLQVVIIKLMNTARKCHFIEGISENSPLHSLYIMRPNAWAGRPF